MRPILFILLSVVVMQTSAHPNNTTEATSTPAETTSTCARNPGDFDCDIDVDFSDFTAFAHDYGLTLSDPGYKSRMDVDGSGAVDFADFVAFARVFGSTYPRPPWFADRNVLVVLYNSTDGPNWRISTNWLTDNDPWTWHGVTVTNGRVTGVYLEGNNLTGTIPAELGNLSHLTHLYLASNRLSGPIPPELGDLSNLSQLTLADNQLSGSIPSELGNLSKLRLIHIAENQLSGPIPVALADLHSLQFALP